MSISQTPDDSPLVPDAVVFGKEAKAMSDEEFEAMMLAMPVGSTIEFPDGFFRRDTSAGE